MTFALVDTTTIGLGKLLSDGSHFVVPHHQRDYSWTEDELSQLFLDVDESMESNVDYYFIGLAVFKPGEDSEYVILDGQQRMATAVLILSAIRQWLRGFGKNRDADQIQSEYIARRQLGEDELHPRLELNEANNSAFHKYVVEECPSDVIEERLVSMKRHDASRTLLEATLFCRSEIARIAGEFRTTDDAAQHLFAMVGYIREGIRVVPLVVPSEADAYTVFETLNDRGLDLTVLDLVKNYVFGKAKTKLRVVKSRWGQMTAILANVRGDDFLKAYWTSRHGRTQKAQLFPSIKRKHSKPDSLVDFSEDLLQASECYAAIELADDPIWSKYSEVTRQRIRILRMLRSNSVHPIILSGAARFSVREFERLLRLLEILIVRFQLICGGRTGIIEIACAKLASEIYNNTVKNATAAFQAIRDIYPSDEEFKESFALKQERTNTKAQYLLRELEIEQRRRKKAAIEAKELEPPVLTVEHIFPRGAAEDWASLLKQDPQFSEDCLYRLGNMALLSSVNRDLGRKGFVVKKKTYATSPLLLTSALSSFDDWNREAVERRQEEMAKLAVHVWRFQ